MTWTNKKVDRLVAMWNSGYSAGAIGRAVGKTKNAVVGKAHRLGLPTRELPIGLSTDQNRDRWSATAEKQLAHDWADNVPLPTIAHRQNKTIAAVERKARRMGLPERSGPTQVAKQKAPVKKPAAPAKVVQIVRAPGGPSPFKTCQFIEGEPVKFGCSDHLKCGEKTIPGSAYCAWHHARCYTRRGVGEAA